jgi:hypothetical protein
MTRIIDHREDAAAGQGLFELRVFQLKDDDVRACVVPADLLVNLDIMADESRHHGGHERACGTGLSRCARAVRDRERYDLMGSRSARPLSAASSAGAGIVTNLLTSVILRRPCPGPVSYRLLEFIRSPVFMPCSCALGSGAF